MKTLPRDRIADGIIEVNGKYRASWYQWCHYKRNTHLLYSMTETKQSRQLFEAAITEYVAPRFSEMNYRRYQAVVLLEVEQRLFLASLAVPP